MNNDHIEPICKCGHFEDRHMWLRGDKKYCNLVNCGCKGFERMFR